MKTENKICYMSEIGHRNFQYPTSKKMILQLKQKTNLIKQNILKHKFIKIMINIY